jgi:hypothetical protein
MSNLIQLDGHPADPAVLLVRTAPDLAPQLGKLQAARYDHHRKAYLLHTGDLPGLESLARYIGAHIVDNRPRPGEHTLPHECAHSAQPASTTRPPAYCPTCGHPWAPVTYHDVDHDADKGSCDHCGHHQTGPFPRCAACGGPMSYPGRRHVELPRTKLADPIPFAQAVADTFPGVESP